MYINTFYFIYKSRIFKLFYNLTSKNKILHWFLEYMFPDIIQTITNKEVLSNKISKIKTLCM